MGMHMHTYYIVALHWTMYQTRQTKTIAIVELEAFKINKRKSRRRHTDIARIHAQAPTQGTLDLSERERGEGRRDSEEPDPRTKYKKPIASCVRK